MVNYTNSHVGVKRGEIYDKRYQIGTEEFYWLYFEKPLLQKIFLRHSQSKQKRYLDFAVGTGRILAVVGQYFSHVVGLDVSEDMMLVAKNKVPKAEFIRMDITREKLDIGKFDVISSFRFLLNAEPELREKALKSLRTAIDDNGVLIVNNHLNGTSLIGIICRIRNLIKGKEHHIILTDNDVRILMASCGFKVVEYYGFGFIPAWRNRFWLPRGLLRFLEKMIFKASIFARFGKDRIYVCTPIVD